MREATNELEPRDRQPSVFDRLGRTQSPTVRHLLAVSLTFATALNGACFSRVSGRYPETDWIPLQANVLTVARRATRDSRVANLRVCSVTTAAGEGPPFSRIHGAVRPNRSICGSKGQQELEDHRRRAPSGPQYAEGGTRRLPDPRYRIVEPVAGINLVRPANKLHQVAARGARVPSDHQLM